MYEDMYLVDNEYSIVNIETLKKYLISEIKRDTLENNDDKDIVKNNMDLLEKTLSKYNTSDFYINELKLYGYDISKIDDIKRNLISLQSYFHGTASNDLEVEIGKDVDKLKEDLEEYLRGVNL